MRTLLPVLIGAGLIAGGLPALAAPGDDIGATVRIVNLVTADYEKDQRRLAKGDSVRQDELIAVGDDGIGEIRLRDDTKLALGPGARLKPDQFVYNPDVSGGAIVVNLVEGAFRFITGLAAKPAYVIRTPTASITVRGTIFDVYVEESGMSWLLLIDGALEVCNARAECALLDEPGRLIRITPAGEVGDPAKWAELPTTALAFETAFPFVVTAPEIDPEPRFSAEDIVSGDLPEAGDGSDDDGGGPGEEPDDDDADDDDIGPDIGPGPPFPLPPLSCWKGWKQVPIGWSQKGWRVKVKRRGASVIWCARPVLPPGGGTGLPPKPLCIGGKVVALMMLPPKWSCVCPKGKIAHKIGKNAYACKDAPGDALGDAKKDCLKKGGTWTGRECILPDPKCPPGFIGKPPKCKKIVIEKCQPGYIGRWPNCKKLVLKKPAPQAPDKLKGLQRKD